jgi:hypothetical protein
MEELLRVVCIYVVAELPVVAPVTLDPIPGLGI